MRKTLLILLATLVALVFLVSVRSTGFKVAAETFQSIGIGFGAICAGLGGLTAFWDWSEKKQEEEGRIKSYKKRFPRRALNKDFSLIRSKTDPDPVYVLDHANNTKYWIKDQRTRKNLGFRSSDVKNVEDDIFKSYAEGDEIG